MPPDEMLRLVHGYLRALGARRKDDDVEASALVALGTLAFVIGVRLIYHEVCGFSSRAPNDVFPFLLKIDMEALNGTFHPEVEESFRSSLPWLEFKRVQWKRIHLAIHSAIRSPTMPGSFSAGRAMSANKAWNG